MARVKHPVSRSLRLWPLLGVLIGVAAGLVVTVIGEQTWRLGCLIIGVSLLVGAVVRAALPAGTQDCSRSAVGCSTCCCWAWVAPPSSPCPSPSRRDALADTSRGDVSADPFGAYSSAG